MEIDLNDVEETLLIPLWGRAQVSRERNSLLNDAKALEIIEQIDYDFSKLDRRSFFRRDLWFAIRAKQFDDKIKAYIAKHPHASVVNIGAGLDTTFYRVDNGSIHWYDLDLPNVIAIRKQLIPETDRTTYIAKSLFESRWYPDIKLAKDGVLLMAAGVLFYFEEFQVRHFFSLLADNLPGGEIVFDALPKLGVFFSNWSVRKAGMKGATVKWTLKDVTKITKWDKRITVIDQLPLFRNIPRDPSWGIGIRRFMDFSDKYRILNIFHLRV
jgi:O-methyltransferase involved in polyketide biosynthesis